jgi:hypothetical protein
MVGRRASLLVKEKGVDVFSVGVVTSFGSGVVLAHSHIDNKWHAVHILFEFSEVFDSEDHTSSLTAVLCGVCLLT